MSSLLFDFFQMLSLLFDFFRCCPCYLIFSNVVVAFKFFQILVLLYDFIKCRCYLIFFTNVVFAMTNFFLSSQCAEWFPAATQVVLSNLGKISHNF